MRGVSWSLLSAALALAGCATPAGQDGSAEAQRLLDEYRRASDVYVAPFRQAKSDEERMKLPPLRAEDDPINVFLPKFQALASNARSEDAQLTALLWIADEGRRVQRIGPEASQKAVEEIFSRHPTSPSLEDFAVGIQYQRWVLPRGTAVAALRTLIEKSPHKAVKGAAIVSLAAMWSGTWPPEGEEQDDAAAEKEWDEAEALLQTAVAECAGTRWADLASGLLYEREHLQVGMTAPDFEAVDADGTAFRLSDYRGKVVVFDFWSFG